LEGYRALSHGPTNPGLLTGNWLAESTRVTLFSNDIRPTSILLKLVGLNPEQVNERPVQNIRQESTSYKTGQLVVSHQPGRLDLIYAPKPPANIFEAANSSPLVYVSELKAALDEIIQIGAKLCDLIPDAVRIALCPIAIRQADTGPHAAILLRDCFSGLPIQNETDSEVVWQVSRKSKAQSFDGSLNSIYKLQSVTTQMISVFMSSQPLPTPQTMVTAHFARFELEVNTDIFSGNLGSTRIFTELSVAVRQALMKPGA